MSNERVPSFVVVVLYLEGMVIKKEKKRKEKKRKEKKRKEKKRKEKKKERKENPLHA